MLPIPKAYPFCLEFGHTKDENGMIKKRGTKRSWEVLCLPEMPRDPNTEPLTLSDVYPTGIEILSDYEDDDRPEIINYIPRSPMSPTPWPRPRTPRCFFESDHLQKKEDTQLPNFDVPNLPQDSKNKKLSSPDGSSSGVDTSSENGDNVLTTDNSSRILQPADPVQPLNLEEEEDNSQLSNGPIPKMKLQILKTRDFSAQSSFDQYYDLFGVHSKSNQAIRIKSDKLMVEIGCQTDN